MEIKSIGNLTCKCFFIFMNISFVMQLSQLYETRGGFVCSIALAGLGILSFFFHYIRYTKLKVSSIFFTMVLFAVGAVAFIMSSGPTLLKMILFIYAVQGVDKEDILNYCKQSLLIAFAIVAISSLLGITDAVYVSNLKIAYRFGLSNPNTVPIVFFAIITAYNLQHDESITYKKIALEAIMTGIVYYFTRSRTGLLVLVFYLAALFFAKILDKSLLFKIVLWPFQYSFLVFAAISYYATVSFVRTNSFWVQINSLLTGRLYAWQRYLERYGINPFGNRLDGSLYGAFDNAYLQLLVKYGWLTFIVYAIMFIVVSRYAYKRRNWVLMMTIIAYQVYFITEFGPILINFCTVLLIFAYVLFDEHKMKPESDRVVRWEGGNDE